VYEVWDEFKHRYTSRPDVHLKAVLDTTESLLMECGVVLSSFASKSFVLSEKTIGKRGALIKKGMSLIVTVK
jgi:hypothetical protein